MTQKVTSTQKSKASTSHQSEIEKSRVGGFGGSDAKMIYKIGMKGLSALSNSDKIRISVAKGLTPYKSVPQTAPMQKGHDFEDWFAETYNGRLHKFKREKKISSSLAHNFKTFAHADFAEPESKSVIELKCIADTDGAMEAHNEQLQWYHMLGAKTVVLVVCDSTYTHFESGLMDPIEVHRNDNVIDILRNGIKLLDENWDDLDLRVGDEWSDADLFPAEQQEVVAMTNYLQEIKNMEAMVEERKAKLFDFMEANNIKSISSEMYNISYVPAGITSRFDKAKLLKDHPEIKEQDYTKTSDRKAYLTVKLKN